MARSIPDYAGGSGERFPQLEISCHREFMIILCDPYLLSPRSVMIPSIDHFSSNTIAAQCIGCRRYSLDVSAPHGVSALFVYVVVWSASCWLVAVPSCTSFGMFGAEGGVITHLILHVGDIRTFACAIGSDGREFCFYTVASVLL